MSGFATDPAPIRRAGVIKAAEDRPPNFLEKISSSIDNFFYRSLGNLGEAVARRPAVTIALTFVVVAVCCVGLVRFEEENRQEELWVPEGSDVKDHFQYFTDTFSSQRRRESFIRVLPGYALTKNGLLQALNDYEALLAIQAEYEGKTYTLDDLCIKTGGACLSESLLALWNYNRGTIEGLTDTAILQAATTATTYPNGETFVLANVVGGIKTTDGETSSASALRTVIYLQNNLVFDNGEDRDPVAEAWEGAVLDERERSLKGSYVNLERSLEDEFGEAIDGDVSLLVGGYVLITAYACLALSRYRPLRNRAPLAFAGVFGVGMSIAVSFGLCSLFGVPYGPLTTALPFLLVGIGVDDVFIITNAFDGTNPDDDTPTRVRTALSRAGTSITVTSFTDFLVFLVGTSTSLPALRFFCAYAAIGIAADYLIQITFFVACLTYSANPKSVLCCTKFNNTEIEPGPGPVKKFIGSIYAPNFLTSTPLRVAAIVLFLGFFGIGLGGATNINQSFDILDFVPDSSYLQDSLDVRDTFFGTVGEPVYIILRDIDFQASQDQLVALETAFPTAEGVLFTDPWFTPWVQSEGADSLKSLTSGEYHSKLITYLQSSRFADDVILEATASSSSNGALVSSGDGSQRIKAARFRGLYRIFDNSRDQVSALNDINSIVDDRDLGDKAFPWAFDFLIWEQQRLIDRELAMNLSLAVIAIALIVILFIPQPTTALLVLLCVVLSVLDVVGFMWLWDLGLNNITVINLVLGLGLSVDYSAHIGHCYSQQEGTRVQKTIHAVREIGSSVLNGGFSTILPVLVLAGSDSYIFRLFFRQFFLIILIGLGHGLILLPTLLSLVGSETPPRFPKSVEMSPSEGEAL